MSEKEKEKEINPIFRVSCLKKKEIDTTSIIADGIIARIRQKVLIQIGETIWQSEPKT